MAFCSKTLVKNTGNPFQPGEHFINFFSNFSKDSFKKKFCSEMLSFHLKFMKRYTFKN